MKAEMRLLGPALATAASLMSVTTYAADLSAYEKINCTNGSTKAQLNCLNRKVAALTERLDRLSGPVSRETPSAGDAFIRYGDQVTISKDDQLCLHSGLFAGFEKCDPKYAVASGFKLHFRLDKPIK